MSRSAEYCARVELRKEYIATLPNACRSSNLGCYATWHLRNLLTHEPMYKRIVDDLRAFLVPIRVGLASSGVSDDECWRTINDDRALLKDIENFLFQQVTRLVEDGEQEVWTFSSELAYHLLIVGVDWPFLVRELLNYVFHPADSDRPLWA